MGQPSDIPLSLNDIARELEHEINRLSSILWLDIETLEKAGHVAFHSLHFPSQ